MFEYVIGNASSGKSSSSSAYNSARRSICGFVTDSEIGFVELSVPFDFENGFVKKSVPFNFEIGFVRESGVLS